jgi:hypothetical protein
MTPQQLEHLKELYELTGSKEGKYVVRKNIPWPWNSFISFWLFLKSRVGTSFVTASINTPEDFRFVTAVQSCFPEIVSYIEQLEMERQLEKNHFVELAREAKAGRELAEAVEKSQEYDYDMLEHSYTLVAKAIATYRESIKGV